VAADAVSAASQFQGLEKSPTKIPNLGTNHPPLSQALEKFRRKFLWRASRHPSLGKKLAKLSKAWKNQRLRFPILGKVSAPREVTRPTTKRKFM
jgi:hypothetical protein